MSQFKTFCATVILALSGKCWFTVSDVQHSFVTSQLMYSTVSYCNQWRPQTFLQEWAKSIPTPVSPFFSSLPSPSLLLSPLHPLFSAVKRIALIQLGVCGSKWGIFWAMNVSCGNDFGNCCVKQNVVTESILYIFQGRASAPLANASGRPWLQYISKRTELLITRHQFY